MDSAELLTIQKQREIQMTQSAAHKKEGINLQT